MFSLESKMAILILIVCLTCSAFGETPNPCSGANKAGKAETYLETAAALIDRLRDSLPQESAADCSCPPKPMDCNEVLKCGYNRSGVYQIWPRNRIIVESVNVYCDMDTSGGGWTVLQRRGEFQRPSDFFYKSWHQYKTGFGDLRRDFWLGNDNIYAITNQNKYYLRIDLHDFENHTRYAFYDQFWIDNESQNYKLHVYDYSGDAGDSLSRGHDGFEFSTMDRDNDNSTEHCSERHKAGWWFASCHNSNLNGIYHGKSKAKASDGIVWGTWKGLLESLRMTEMKIRPMNFKAELDFDVELA